MEYSFSIDGAILDLLLTAEGHFEMEVLRKGSLSSENNVKCVGGAGAYPCPSSPTE